QYYCYHLHLPSFPTRRSSDLRLRDRIIDRDDHDCVATRTIAAHLHARDVDVFLAEQRADGADHTGAIRVPAHQEGALWHQVDAEDRKSTRLNSSHLVISYAVF